MPDHVESSYHLTIPSDLRALAVVRATAEAVCQLRDLDSQVAYQVVLATNEACSNIIRHAHQNQAQLPIDITFHLQETGVEVVLRDQGPAFDLESVPELDPTEIRRGGRGLVFIRRAMERVTCEHLEEGGNVLRMFRSYQKKSD